MAYISNRAFFHSAKEFIFEDKSSLHFWGPNERFGKIVLGSARNLKNCPGECKVSQISSRGVYLFFIYTIF